MKKIIALLLVVVLTAAAAIGGTLAYLTDRDSEANVFTVGNVDIDLNEDFNQGATLIPGVDIEKKPTIKNVGPNAAYVWATVAVPAALDDVINFSGEDTVWGTRSAGTSTTIDGKNYTLYTVLHTSALGVGGVTGPLFSKVALKNTVDIDPNGQWYTVVNGATTDLGWNNADGNPVIYVSAYAIQTEGFADVNEAYAAYNTQWGSGGTEYSDPIPADATIVKDAAELQNALANAEAGEVIALNNDIALQDAPIVIAEDTTLNLNGKTLSGVSTSNTTSNLLKVNSGATLTISNGTVSFGATTPDTNWGGEGQPAFPGYANNTISNSGKLIIDGATIENKTAPGGASYAIDNYPGADLVINNGVIDGQGKTAIRLFANSTTQETNVTVNGGTITGSRAIWIQLPGSNTQQAPEVNVTITGGKLISTLDPSSDNYVAMYSYSYGQSFANTNVTITGGEFTGHVIFGGGAKADVENVTITGGTFNGELGRYVADNGTNNGWADIAKP